MGETNIFLIRITHKVAVIITIDVCIEITFPLNAVTKTKNACSNLDVFWFFFSQQTLVPMIEIVSLPPTIGHLDKKN